MLSATPCAISEQITPDDSAAAACDFLGIVHNPDGSVTSKRKVPTIPASSDPTVPSSVLTKDIPINESKNTWLRVFLPRKALDDSTKLPLIIYFHGGGLMDYNPGVSFFHRFSATMATEVDAIVVSPSFRMPPIHRFPVSYDDCVEAIHFIKTLNEEWLTKFADYSNCYVMGTSSGGNMAYYAGLRAAVCADDLRPLMIKGIILRQPLFGGSKRTQSELRCDGSNVMPLYVTDFMWEKALPVGADRDHEYCNPTVGGGSPSCDLMKKLGWRILVSGSEGDWMFDHHIKLIKMLQDRGVEVVEDFSEEHVHGIEFYDATHAKTLCEVIKGFILSASYA